MGIRDAYDSAVARNFRSAQLQRRRWARAHDAFLDDMRPKDLDQLIPRAGPQRKSSTGKARGACLTC